MGNHDVDDVCRDESRHEPECRDDHDARQYRSLLSPIRRKQRAEPSPLDAPFNRWFLGLIDVRPHQPVPGHHGLVRNRHLMQRDFIALEIFEGRDLADGRVVRIFDGDAFTAQVGDRLIDIINLEHDP